MLQQLLQQLSREVYGTELLAGLQALQQVYRQYLEQYQSINGFLERRGVQAEEIQQALTSLYHQIAAHRTNSLQQERLETESM